MIVNFTRYSYGCSIVLLTLVFTLMSNFANGQGTTDARVSVSGTIKDGGDGTFVPGVSISISDSKAGTVSNIDGAFTIKANAGSTLTFSIVGYLPFTYKVK